MWITDLGVRRRFPPLSSRSGFFYRSARYQEAYLSLLDYLHRRDGIAVLSGEAGTGKTTLLRHLWAAYEADPTVQCLFFAYPSLTWSELIGFLCEDLQVKGTAERETLCKRDLLVQLLYAKAQRGETVVLLLDDAHQLSEDVLAQLPCLASAAAGGLSLLPIVLSGRSPVLEVKLRRAELASLHRLVSVQCRLDPLPPTESLAFLRAYLTAGAYAGCSISPPDPLQLIAQYAGGVPATLVALCDKVHELA
ncbi:MAG: AAA family ATPase, partial [Candidatus Binatia bacterium]|nr:AAA family ATPase [Candidatus Binatia bacterium]